MSTRSIATIGFILFIGACGRLGLPLRTTDANLGGDGLPVQTESRPIPHDAQRVTGVVWLRADGCWVADVGESQTIVIFPVGFHKPVEDGSQMRSPDGEAFADGTPFEGVGGYTPVDALPGVPDGYFGSYLAFCEPTAHEVLILDSMRAVDVSDPA